MKADNGLPFLLKFKNVARYEDGKIIILDRRVYPNNIEYVTCDDYEDVAEAIRNMVTQSLGPWAASAYGMVNASRKAKHMDSTKAKKVLIKAAHILSHSRPTTSESMTTFINKILDFAISSIEKNVDLEKEVLNYVETALDQNYKRDRKICNYVVSLLPDPAVVLTQCYAETLIGFVLLLSLEQGKKISLICPETRPFLQGARLTASVAADLGIPVTVVTDNMPGYILSQGIIDAFVCAADVITMDGYVVNKIGTYQISLAAHDNKVPFYVTRNPSLANPTINTVKIEERNPQETLSAMGIKTTKEGVNGYYPAFDITPPHLVSAVITSQGIFSPYDLNTTYLKKLHDHPEY